MEEDARGGWATCGRVHTQVQRKVLHWRREKGGNVWGGRGCQESQSTMCVCCGGGCVCRGGGGGRGVCPAWKARRVRGNTVKLCGWVGKSESQYSTAAAFAPTLQVRT
jgi:hypothetical protein